MKKDRLGRNRPNTSEDFYGACRCCDRWFVEEVTDPLTEARRGRDGWCGGCTKNADRKGTATPTCRHDFPGSLYRCKFTTEENARHAARFLHRIAGSSRRMTTP